MTMLQLCVPLWLFVISLVWSATLGGIIGALLLYIGVRERYDADNF